MRRPGVLPSHEACRQEEAGWSSKLPEDRGGLFSYGEGPVVKSQGDHIEVGTAPIQEAPQGDDLMAASLDCCQQTSQPFPRDAQQRAIGLNGVKGEDRAHGESARGGAGREEE